jgi:hypothetical protein
MTKSLNDVRTVGGSCERLQQSCEHGSMNARDATAASLGVFCWGNRARGPCKPGQHRRCWVSPKGAEERPDIACLKARENEYIPLRKLTPMALEIAPRDLTNRVNTWFPSVGHAADSPESLFRPSATIGHDAEIPQPCQTNIGYDTQKLLPPSCTEAMGLLCAGWESGRAYAAVPVRSSSA